ncbi:MAG TPA: hypothetical protein VGK90_12400 [Rhizomicrobium sp.]
MTTAETAQTSSDSLIRWSENISEPADITRNAVVRFAAVFLFFSLATLVIFLPNMAHLHSALIGPPEDNMQDFWNTWYAVLGRDPHHFFTTKLLRFPEGTSLVYQSFAYPQVFAVVALSRIFGSDLGTLIALQNLTLLASFPLAAVGSFYLVRHFVQSTFGGLVGGFVFAFNPSHIIHVMHHAHVSSIEFLPFFALAYLAAVERRSARYLIASALFCALSALSCWYYLFYCAYFMGFQLLYARVRDGRWPEGWPLAAPIICASLTILILSPLIVPMVLAASPSVYNPGGNIFVADLLGYIAFPPDHLLSGLSRGLYQTFAGNPWEATVYLGLVNLAVLGWQCRRTGLERHSLMFYVLFGMLAFALLASGETLHIFGFSTYLPLPDAGLDRLPFFANVRTPSRAIVFVYLFMSIGVGAAAAAIWQQHIKAKIAALALAAAIIVDFYPATLAATPVTCSPDLRVLAEDPQDNFGVLNFPWGYAEENSYMLEQVCHHRSIVDGMTTREMADTLLYRLSLKDLAKQREQLTASHVKYILLHPEQAGHYHWNKEIAPAAEFLKTYRTVYSGRDMTILRVY